MKAIPHRRAQNFKKIQLVPHFDYYNNVINRGQENMYWCFLLYIYILILRNWPIWEPNQGPCSCWAPEHLYCNHYWTAAVK